MQQRGTNDGRWSARLVQAVVFAVVIAVFWGLDTLSKRNVRVVDGVGLDDFRLFAEQGTSALAVWLLIPAVAWWLRRFPIDMSGWPRTLGAHLLGSVLFASAHYALMIAMRALIYSLNDIRYQLSDFWFNNLILEWQRDLKIYVAAIGILLALEYLRQRRAVRNERMWVQSANGTHLVNFDDIEYFEAARNYVSVHTAKREFLLRQTIASLDDELCGRGFVRIHRSYIVNQNRVAGIENTSNGQELLLASGRHVPLSRRRRDTVRAQLGI